MGDISWSIRRFRQNECDNIKLLPEPGSQGNIFLELKDESGIYFDDYNQGTRAGAEDTGCMRIFVNYEDLSHLEMRKQG